MYEAQDPRMVQEKLLQTNIAYYETLLEHSLNDVSRATLMRLITEARDNLIAASGRADVIMTCNATASQPSTRLKSDA
jgi:hypothetical protein